MEMITAYEGAWTPGQEKKARKSSHQCIRESHRDLMDKLAANGNEALNAADYERTMHLPVGRGRLACDETGEFDKKAPRPHYNPNAHPKYPRYLHSTVTEDEDMLVKDAEQEKALLITGEWSETPLERRRRFKLTPDAQMDNLQAQIVAERARGLELERKYMAAMAKVSGAAPPATVQELLELLKAERDARAELEAKVNAMASAKSVESTEPEKKRK